MKVCPKCHSSYSDETLNFCLTDGVPLVGEEVYQSRQSSQNSWQEAETLHDSRFALPISGAHTTSPNSSSPTFSAPSSHSSTFSSEASGRSSKKILYSAAAIVLAAAAGAGIYFRYNAVNESANPPQTAVPSTTVVVKKAFAPLTEQQQEEVKKSVSETILSWAKTNSQKNIDAHIDHYANTLEVYYGESGKDRNHVRADRLRAYQRYDSILMQVDNLQITPESEDSATAVFDKSWTMKNAQKTSTGSVQQEIHLVKLGGRWLINGERDVKVYYINNRENQTSETSAQNANAVNSTNANSNR
jgi:hypothetical protein